MSERKLTILQINDLHGYLEPHPEVFRARGGFRYETCGGLARIASVFKQVRAERPDAVLALDNGDTFHGTYVAVKSRGEAIVPLMNALGYDAMTAHWEFAYGPEQFRKLASELSYPVLAINCYEADSERLVFAPSGIVERAGLRIGIVGIASNIVDKSMPPSYSTGVRFTLGNLELPGHLEHCATSKRSTWSWFCLTSASRRTPSLPPRLPASMCSSAVTPTTACTGRSGSAARRSSSRAAMARSSGGST
jgi:S-sulfosulfanyl-L-cysteine sulfohydrolase